MCWLEPMQLLLPPTLRLMIVVDQVSSSTGRESDQSTSRRAAVAPVTEADHLRSPDIDQAWTKTMDDCGQSMLSCLNGREQWKVSIDVIRP